MGFEAERPYNDLPELPPQVELESKAVLKRAIAARAALAELKGAGDLLPNQAVLVSSLVLQEAKASSEIENIVTTNDELYRALGPDDEKASAATKEVLRYREALWHGFQQLSRRPLSTNVFIEVCRTIRQIEIDVRRVPGTRIARGDGQVIYTPPEGEDVIRAKLANLEAFLHAEDELDPLVKLAVMHYQFEAIHPFTDGNGRTGRILNILFLVERGLLDLPVLYLSGYILANRQDYYVGLRRVTEEQSWEDWLLYMLRAVEATANDTRRRVLAICDAMREAQDSVHAQEPAVYSKDLIEFLFEQPYCRIPQLMERLQLSRPTASKYLRTLAELGLLRATKAGRDMLFINMPLLRLLREPLLGPD